MARAAAAIHGVNLIQNWGNSMTISAFILGETTSLQRKRGREVILPLLSNSIDRETDGRTNKWNVSVSVAAATILPRAFPSFFRCDVLLHPFHSAKR